MSESSPVHPGGNGTPAHLGSSIERVQTLALSPSLELLRVIENGGEERFDRIRELLPQVESARNELHIIARDGGTPPDIRQAAAQRHASLDEVIVLAQAIREIGEPPRSDLSAMKLTVRKDSAKRDRIMVLAEGSEKTQTWNPSALIHDSQARWMIIAAILIAIAAQAASQDDSRAHLATHTMLLVAIALAVAGVMTSVTHWREDRARHVASVDLRDCWRWLREAVPQAPGWVRLSSARVTRPPDPQACIRSLDDHRRDRLMDWVIVADPLLGPLMDGSAMMPNRDERTTQALIQLVDELSLALFPASAERAQARVLRKEQERIGEHRDAHHLTVDAYLNRRNRDV